MKRQTKFKEIDLGKFKHTEDEYQMSIPFTIAFVFAKSGNYAIKGMEDQVKKEINNHLPCHYNITYWNKAHAKDKPVASYWEAKLKDCDYPLYLEKNRKAREKRYTYQLHYMVDGYRRNIIAKWRKVPQKYIEELTELNLKMVLERD